MGSSIPPLAQVAMKGLDMEELQEVVIQRPGGDPLRVGLAMPEEIWRMSDIRAIEKIDELREAARVAAAAGLEEESRALYASACDIVEHNLIAPETIGEYADLLDSQGLSGPAADYRAWHAELMGKLAEYDLPKPAYEERLRAEVVQRRQHARPQARAHGQAGARERLGEVAAQARSASHSLGEHSSRGLPEPGRGLGHQ